MPICRHIGIPATVFDCTHPPVATGLDNLAHQPESIYIKPDMPGINQDGLTGLNKAHNCDNSHQFSQDYEDQKQNLESTVATGLDNLAHQPDSIYIKPDVPAEIQDSLIIENKLGNSDNSDGFSSDCSNQSQNTESTVATGLDNLAHQPDSIYIDVPAEIQDSLTIENKAHNSDNSDQFSSECPNQKQKP